MYLEERERIWKLGRDLISFHDSKSYRAKWRTFDEFAAKELGCSGKRARVLIAVARVFTVEQMKAYGWEKLYLALRAPPNEREGLLEACRTKRELEARVRNYDTKKFGAPRKSAVRIRAA